jgi:hypothetical protein
VIEFHNWLLNIATIELNFDIQLSDDSPIYRISRKIDDYIYRNKSLESISVYWFYTKYYKTKFLVDCDKNNKLLFLEEHPQYLTHYLGSYTKDKIKIPVLNAKIPYYPKCDSDILKDRHAQLTLLLFMPFRNIDDLQPQNVSWDEAFQNWINNGDDKSLSIYNNMQDYYTGRIRASETQQQR